MTGYHNQAKNGCYARLRRAFVTLCLLPSAAANAGHVEMAPLTVQDTFVTPA